ncbi:MAG TPA: PHP domain-containing protein [Bacillota bacterium]|nr:PHP domain-containing protein [Bacillota bacterium]
METADQPGVMRVCTGVTPADVLMGAGLPALKAHHIVSTLAIQSVAYLEEAVRRGSVKALLGGTTNMDDHVLRFIRLGKRIAPSTQITDQTRAGVPLAYAAWVGRMVVSALRAMPGVLSAVTAGQVRRQCEVVDSLDLVVSTENPADLARAPVGLPVVVSAAATPDVLHADVLGMDIRIHVTTPRSLASRLLDATGSACHVHRLAELAAERGLFLDRGVLVHSITGRQVLLEDEAEIYAQLGLPFIPPEYRVGSDEVEEALAGTLPCPVGHEDIQGDLHLHTDWSDGLDTVEDMVAEAMRRGYSYVAVSDHTAYHSTAHGLSAKRLLAQWDAIEALQRRCPSIAILKSAEVDILPDGTLDMSDDVLHKADIVLASVHKHLDMEPRALTRRLIRAMENPHVDVLAHPTGRSIGLSDYRVDVDELTCAAARLKVGLEINCAPDRLDIDERLARRCNDLGIALAIGSDAHSVGEMDQFGLGVGVARRARCTSHSILNTRSPQELRAWLDWHRND